MKLAVFLPNWIGDAVLATPALRALRRHFADANLVGVGRPAVADVLAGTPWLDDFIAFDPAARDRIQRTLATVSRLRRLRADLALLLTNSFRTALLAWMGSARQRVGYARDARGWLLSRAIEPPWGRGRPAISAMDAYLDLTAALGCPAESRRVELATLPADERAAGDAWERLGLPGGRRVVVLNTGGAFGTAKLWPQGHFAALARRIVTQNDRHVLVLCGPNERELARQIVRAAGHPRVTSLAELPLGIGLSKACVRRAGLMVTTDSGPRHFAAAFDVPVVTIFGPTRIELSENYHARAAHLQLPIDCAPCQQRACPLGHHRCMREMSVERVYRTVAEQLAQQERTAA